MLFTSTLREGRMKKKHWPDREVEQLSGPPTAMAKAIGTLKLEDPSELA